MTNLRVNVSHFYFSGVQKLEYSVDVNPPGSSPVNLPSLPPHNFVHPAPHAGTISWAPVSGTATVTVNFNVSSSSQCPFKWSGGTQWSPAGQATFPNALGPAILNDGWSANDYDGIKYSVELVDGSTNVSEDPEVIIIDSDR
jgi:hypothetical protein